MNNSKEKNPEHIEIDSKIKSEHSENPLAHYLNVTVSIPETIEIKMVDASVLADYEVWVFISSILGSAVTGFLVAYCQNNQGSLLAMTIILAILFLISLIMSSVKRCKLKKKSQIVELKATDIIKK